MPAVDSLNIKVDASARSANQQLDKLVKKMVELRQTLGTINVDGLNAFTKSMNHFTNAAKALSGIKTSDFTKMAKNLDKLSDTQKLEKTAQNTQKAADSLQKATTIAKTALGNSFKTDGTGIQKMQKSIQALSKEYANAGKGSKFDGTLSELEKEAGKLEKKLDALGEKEQKMLAVGSSTDSKAFKGLQYDISVTLNQLSTLEEKIAQVKASQAQNISNLPIIRYEAPTGNTSLASQNIKEQTEKVEQTDKVEQTEKVFETIPESARYSVEKAQKALQDALKSVHIDKGQSSAFRNYSEEIKNLKAELKSLETAGYGMGSAKWDETYIKLQKVVAEAKEYKANLSKPSTGLERDIQKTASLGNQLEGLKDKLKGLKANGQNFGDAEFDDTYRQIQKASSALSKYKADLKATGNSKSSLDRLKDTFRSIWNMTKKAGSALSDFGKRARNLIPGFGLLSNSTNGLIGKIAKLYIAIRSLRGVADYMKNAVTSSMDYIEEYNYFDTTMDKIGLEWGKDYKKYGYRNATEYGDSFKSRLTQTLGKMSGFQINEDGSLTDRDTKNLGLDITQMTNYAAGIAQVTNSVGMAGEASVVTSKALSMLAGDMSSFRNQDLSTVMNNFSSGLMGQSRALYKYGIDITNTTLQQYALANGVNKSVSEMSQSEKMQLRMLAILDQSRVSWGDLAKTINSPSNQLRLLNNNFKALARTVGNMFLPVVAKVLPYVNGLVIAVRRLFEWSASMLGIDLKDVIKNSGVGSSDAFDGLEEDANNADTAVGNIGDSADKSSDSVKKLAKQLMGFDELNVINTNDTGSSSKNDKNNNGDSTPIDLTSQLSDALADYEKVWNKAYKNMTNDAEKFADKLTKLFKNAWKSGNGSDIGTAIAKWLNKGIDWVNKHTGQFANGCKKIANILATSVNGFVRKLKWSGLGKAIGNSMKAVIEAETHFFDTVNWLNLGKGIAKSLNAWIATGVIQSLFRNTASKLRAAIELAFGAITTFKFDKLGTAIGQGINDFFKKMNKKNKQTGLNGWQELGKSLSTGISGIVTSIVTAIEAVNWSKVGSAIGDMISSIDFAKVIWKLVSLAVSLVNAIGAALGGSISKAPIETSLIMIFAGLKLSGLASGKLLPIASKFISTFATSIGEKSVIGVLSSAFKNTVVSSLGKGLGGLNAASLAAIVAPFLDVLAGVLALDALAYTISLKVNSGDIKKAKEWQDEIDKINQKTEELEENIQDIQDVIKKTNKVKLTLKTDTDEGTDLQVLADQYFKLSKKTHLSAVEKKRLKEKSEELIEKIPELKKHIDKESGAYKGTKENLQKLVNKTKEYYKLQAADDALKDNAKAQLKNSQSLKEAVDNRSKALKKYTEAKKKYDKAMATGGDYLNTKKQMESAEKAYKKADTTVGKLTKTSKKLSDQQKYLDKYIDSAAKSTKKDTNEKNKNKKATNDAADAVKKLGNETKDAKKKVGNGVTVKTKIEKDKNYDKKLKEWKSMSDKLVRAKMNGASTEEFDALFKEWSSLTDEFITKTAKGNEDQAYKDMASTWKTLQDKNITANAFGEQKKGFTNLMSEWNNLNDKNVSVKYSDEANASFWKNYNNYKNMKNRKNGIWNLKIAGDYKKIQSMAKNPLLSDKGKMNVIKKTLELTIKAKGSKGLSIEPEKVVSNFFKNFKANGGIFSGGSWHNIAKYAGGGMPGMGQMFIAREAGPELVGRIGNHTAVMNNNQIVASVSDGVFNAMAPVLTQMCNAINTMNTGSGQPLYVEGVSEGDIVKITTEANRVYKKRHGKSMY